MGSAQNSLMIALGGITIAYEGAQPSVDGRLLSEQLLGRAFRIGRGLAGGYNFRQLRAATRLGRSFGRGVPQVALGAGFFLATYTAATFAICALQ